MLGTFTDTHRLRVFYRGEIVGDLDMDFLHNGLPRHTKKAVWDPPQHPEPALDQVDSIELTEDLCRILASPNVASKEWVIRQYDHEVQGAWFSSRWLTRNDGPGDACITTPVLGSRKGVVVANGINPNMATLIRMTAQPRRLMKRCEISSLWAGIRSDCAA